MNLINLNIRKERKKNTPPLWVKEIKRNFLIRRLYKKYRSICDRDIFSKRCRIDNKGYGSFSKTIRGSNNSIVIGENAQLIETEFHIIGSNNNIAIGNNVFLGKNCSLWIEGNNIQIIIGDNSTFTHNVYFDAQENNTYIKVGEDCMFSHQIYIRTSDAHPIFDMNTGQRTNYAKSVIIGNHVWIAPDTKIMKGAQIEDGCIIGTWSMVNGFISKNTLAVGVPAKMIKSNIQWSRDDIIFNDKKNK